MTKKIIQETFQIKGGFTTLASSAPMLPLRNILILALLDTIWENFFLMSMTFSRIQRLRPSLVYSNKKYVYEMSTKDPKDSGRATTICPRIQVLIKVWKDGSPKVELQFTWKKREE